MRIRWHHLLGTVLLVAAVFIVGLLAGWWFGAFHYPYRTLPRPPLPPGQTVPSCSSGSNHVRGQCLPRPQIENQAAITATTQGPDFSNNNPVYSSSAWAQIAAKNAFAIFKVNEGTGYVDPTARTMAAQAKAHGLVVGGYDFLHVCLVDPSAEARVFVAALKADGLTGAKTLPGTGDAEYGGSGCNARSWIETWVLIVHQLTGRWAMIYTGAWWWQPHEGSFWPPDELAWISGYGVRYPYMPSGRSKLDIWQFADNGYNGYNSTDLSTWRDGASAFEQLTGAAPPPPPPDPHRIFPKTVFSLPNHQHASEYNTLGTWDHAKCVNPVRRPICQTTRYHIQLLHDRQFFIATHQLVHGKWVTLKTARWGYAELGLRFATFSRVLVMTKR